MPTYNGPLSAAPPILLKACQILPWLPEPGRRADQPRGCRGAPAQKGRRKKGRTIAKGCVAYKAGQGESYVRGYEYETEHKTRRGDGSAQ
jgi:hypothetical protein